MKEENATEEPKLIVDPGLITQGGPTQLVPSNGNRLVALGAETVWAARLTMAMNIFGSKTGENQVSESNWCQVSRGIS